MARFLIAIVNCRSRQNWATAVRNSWMPTMLAAGADVKFFVGRGDTPVEDCVELDCDDSYQGLPDKVREIIRWAYAQGYEYVLKCDDDVVLHPKLILASGFDKHDFVGHEHARGAIVPYGFNYWLSRKAMKVMLDEPLPAGSNNDEAWVTHTLRRADIRLHHDNRYCLHEGYGTVSFNNERRALRKNPKSLPPKTAIPGTFSWCMYINWNGFHKTPDKIAITEFTRIYDKHVKDS